MGRLQRLLWGLILLLGTVPALARDNAAGETEVRQGFEQILDDWRAGRLAELYERTSGGKMTREAFVRHFSDAELKPTCCWDKLQEVRITMQSASRATLRGTVGLESSVGTESKTKAFKLSKEDGVWRVSQSELVALAGAVKKKHKKRYVTKNP